MEISDNYPCGTACTRYLCSTRYPFLQYDLYMKTGRKKTITTCLFLLLVTAVRYDLQAQWLWDVQKMHTIKGQLASSDYAPAYSTLILEADSLLLRQHTYSVTQKEGIAPSGDKHDYVSLSRYWWPNPGTPDRLPYIYKDGQSNPELNHYDRNTLGNMCSAVNTLSLAYFYSEEEKYAQKAVEILRTWFLNKDTRMNPHLEYAQFIPGRNGSKGRPEGLIDSYSFVDMLNSIQLLNGSPDYTPQDREALKQWFRDFANWFQVSRQGKMENIAKNNHSTSYDAQLISYHLFAGNEKAARAIIRDFPGRRIFAQIEPDGKQPNELWRTLAYHYSQYNLSHMIDVCAMAKRLGIDLLHSKSADGRSIFTAMDYLTSFLGKEVSSWPYQQISGWEAEHQDICNDLVRILDIDPGQDAYRNLVRTYARQDTTDRWRLLYGAE